ncbi:pectate lyase family protein [Nocardiopsis alba]|uniref:pectate lyase family protein n=1 Tax=Nocardiopsis alba TaxID=53437 RepID=UPI0033AA04C2
MRPHPLVAACVAALMCAALTSCSREDDGRNAEPTAGAAVDPGPEETEETGTPSEDPEEEPPFGTPVGWAGHPGQVEETEEPDEVEEDDEDGEEVDDPEEHTAVTGGAEGETVTAKDADELAEHLRAEEPLIVEVEGGIDLDGRIRVGSDKTLLGVGEGAELTGGALVVEEAANVVIANVTMPVDETAVSIGEGSHHVWVDGSTFSGGDGDPLVSVTDDADHITLSWNRFTDAEAAILIDGGDDEERARAPRVTVHHNFFDGTTARHPRALNAEHVHVFNNYFRDNPEYGVSSADGANVLVEGNYFERTPLSVASEKDDEPGNVATRDNLLVDSDQPELRGEVPDPPYAYELDDTVTIPDLVGSRAGAH